MPSSSQFIDFGLTFLSDESGPNLRFEPAKLHILMENTFEVYFILKYKKDVPLLEGEAYQPIHPQPHLSILFIKPESPTT